MAVRTEALGYTAQEPTLTGVKERQPKEFVLLRRRTEAIRGAINRVMDTRALLEKRDTSSLFWGKQFITLPPRYILPVSDRVARSRATWARDNAIAGINEKTLPYLDKKRRVGELALSLRVFTEIQKQYDAGHSSDDLYEGAKEDLLAIVKDFPSTTQFGEVLEACRVGLGLSQGQLADRIDVARQTINRLENGQQQPHASTVVKLATDGFGWSKEHFLTQMLFKVGGIELKVEKPEDRVRIVRPGWGALLIALRERKALSQTAAGGWFDNTGAAVFKWEKEENEPDLDTIVTLCRIYGASEKERDKVLGLLGYPPLGPRKTRSRREDSLFSEPEPKQLEEPWQATKKPTPPPPSPERRGLPPAPEGLKLHSFPNGREAYLPPTDVLFAEALPFYPAPSAPAGTLAKTVFAEEIAARKLSEAQAKRRFSDYVKRTKERFFAYDVVIINETPQTRQQSRRSATYFGVAVDQTVPLAHGERKTLEAVLKQKTPHEYIDFEQLQADIWADHGIEATIQERNRMRPVSGREAMVYFAAGVVKAMHEQDRRLWEQLKPLVKGTKRANVLNFISTIASKIAIAEESFYAPKQPPLRPEPAVAVVREGGEQTILAFRQGRVSR